MRVGVILLCNRSLLRNFILKIKILNLNTVLEISSFLEELVISLIKVVFSNIVT